jgi:hypothetical protein
MRICIFFNFMISLMCKKDFKTSFTSIKTSQWLYQNLVISSSSIFKYLCIQKPISSLNGYEKSCLISNYIFIRKDIFFHKKFLMQILGKKSYNQIKSKISFSPKGKLLWIGCCFIYYFNISFFKYTATFTLY